MYRESLAIQRQLGDQQGIGITLHNLGTLAEQAGDLPKAQRLGKEALPILERLGSPDSDTACRSLQRIQEKDTGGGESKGIPA